MKHAGAELTYRLLQRLVPPPARGQAVPRPDPDRALRIAFGDGIFERVRGRRIADFGCGPGTDAVQLACHGAARVYGIDIQERHLERGRQSALAAGVADRCTFVRRLDEPVDLVISKDAFEHFEDPAEMLEIMAGLLGPDGEVLASFGPTWLHPKGGHLFSVFPWSHLVLPERALLRWRSDFIQDGATRFEEVTGGLNRMTIARFERLVARSPLRLTALETVPIRGVGVLRHPWLREFGSSLVRARLVPRTAR